jgi:Archaeal PaREP1/PaREP8 family.
VPLISINVETVAVPETIIRELRNRGIDAESLIVELLVRALNLDPKTTAQRTWNWQCGTLRRVGALLIRILFRRSEKLYKAAEESVKAAASCLSLDVLRQVENKGRWTVAELDKAAAARGISNKVGDWFLAAWDTAWVLHVWGFHEAKLSSESVKARELYVAKLLRRLRNCAKHLKPNITSAHVPFPSSLCP